ncbi:MAG: hypothetical protein ACR652_26745 [Methylocystis sp.]|uniref:hypothetical protein n=1 Tax=Methylocystis sp. TaxID=1911079 RepID=UPI003DA5D649
MSRSPEQRNIDRLDPEKVAYWYFRLNGFLQIENFVVHPERRGGQRTDADLLAVRFPYRAERLFDNPQDIMADDEQRLALSNVLIDVVIAEVKTNQPCTLNGPWTRSDQKNVHRVLAAIGCLPPDCIERAAENIYRAGIHAGDGQLRVRLVAVGRNQSEELAAAYPEVKQLIWSEVLSFIWDRLHRYRSQKTQVDQWDLPGRAIKHLADASPNTEAFIDEALHLMGVETRHSPQ